MDITQQASQANQMNPQGGFSGTVNVQGTPVEIKQGRASFQGQQFFVSNDGKYVVDPTRNLVGIIQDGSFVRATPEIIDQLRQEGIVGNG